MKLRKLIVKYDLDKSLINGAQSLGGCSVEGQYQSNSTSLKDHLESKTRRDRRVTTAS
uniref:Uncharacterized protein n=1 Tax=Rhizophagus irregularis (strain DAOM 181602 / DAOM 197198 / MUCL 43194) TaxID=747089 RepID=U9UC10_RHIID